MRQRESFWKLLAFFYNGRRFEQEWHLKCIILMWKVVLVFVDVELFVVGTTGAEIFLLKFHRLWVYSSHRIQFCVNIIPASLATMDYSNNVVGRMDAKYAIMTATVPCRLRYNDDISDNHNGYISWIFRNNTMKIMQSNKRL
jgi:hypothetical protein